MSRTATGLLLALALVAGCAEQPPQRAEAPVAPLPPGDALPPQVDAMLYGSAQTCRVNDCPGGVCYYGACVGLLVVDQRWMQVEITERIVAAVEAREALRPRVIAALVRQLDLPKADLAIRARALLPLEGLQAKEALLRALEDPDERLQAAAALALTRLGEDEGLGMARALTEHEEMGIAAEALRALGTSKLAGSLVPLLRTLNANLDAVLLRAALDGLRKLGDLRAVRPLQAWLADAPEYLHHEILVTLRVLTGAPLGNDVEEWGRWIETNDAPPPPEYTLRVQTAEEELGLPAP